MSDNNPNEPSSKTFARSSSLSDLVPLRGGTEAIKHANVHFTKISKAVQAGFAKCYNCPEKARQVAIVQVENPDGLLIHAVCPACWDRHEAAIEQFKTKTNALSVSWPSSDKESMLVKPIGSQRLSFPVRRGVPRVDDREIVDAEIVEDKT